MAEKTVLQLVEDIIWLYPDEVEGDIQRTEVQQGRLHIWTYAGKHFVLSAKELPPSAADRPDPDRDGQLASGTSSARPEEPL